MKINGYTVVWADTLQGLEAEVTEALKNGWVPQGGIFIIEDRYRNYYQAMVSEVK